MTKTILLIAIIAASCQKDAMEVVEVATQQAQQITRVQEMRRQVRADMERRSQLRAEVAAALAATDSLTRFIMGIDHPSFRKYDWHKTFIDPFYEPLHRALDERVPGIIIKQ
jgi:hypothetical protein